MAGTARACGAILVVDDDAGFRALVCDALAQAGYETLEAERGDQAYELALKERPALALLDVNLPGLSGYELCHRIHKDIDGGLPVIFVSGDRTESFDRVAGLLIGADDYLVKPVAPDELVVRVRSVLRRLALPVPERMAQLTKRELEVLRLLAAGRIQQQIADELTISAKTVGTHIEHILVKLDVGSRSEAIVLAYREGLVQAT
jgi:two-component system, OmpR family, response regulator